MKQRTYIIIFVVIASMVVLYYSIFSKSDKNTIELSQKMEHSVIKEKDHIKIDYNIPNFSNIQTNVFFDISCNNKKMGIIEIELFDDDVPLTAKNFRYLCSNNDKSLTYNNSMFHRIIKGHLIQGGDITNNDGTGGKSAYGEWFNHENYNLKHNQEGLVSMANCGKGKCNSQFLISTRRGGCKELDRKYVVCGIVVKGYDIIKEIEKSTIDDMYSPIKEYKITKCGLIGMKECVVEDNSLLDDLNINEKFRMNDMRNIKISI